MKINKPLLAADYDPKLQRFPCLVSGKIDGLRCRIIDGKPMSRSMKLIPNLWLQKLVADSAELLEGLDGELTVGEPNDPKAFQNSTGPLRRVDGQPQVQYHVFDYIRHDVVGLPYQNRLRQLCMLLGNQDLPSWVRLVHHDVCLGHGDLEAMEAKLISEGYEGMMVRCPKGLYKNGRSTVKEGILLKVKRFVSCEAKVIGFIEEMQNCNEAKRNEVGRMKRSNHSENMVAKGTLGALVGEIINGPFKGTQCQVGSGFTKTERLKVWKNRRRYIGQIFTMSYFPVGCQDKPRHPTMVGWRAGWDMD